MPSGFITPLVTAGSVSLDGTAGIFAFVDGLGNGVGAEVNGSSISFLVEQSYWLGAAVGGSNPSFAGYDLQSAMGPLTVDNPSAGAWNVPTSLGTFSMWSVSSATFTATTGNAVPEPATVGLAGSILLLAGLTARASQSRRKK